MRTSQTDQLTEQLFELTTTVMKHSQLDAMRRFAELDLSFSQLRALFTLAFRERPLALSELAEQIGLSVAATGRAIDGLHGIRLVARREDERDRRIKRIELTADGRALMSDMLAARRAALRAVVARLPEAEQARLSAALEPALASLTDQQEGSP